MSTYDRLELDGFHFYYSGREGDYFKHKKLPLKGTVSGGHLTVYKEDKVMFSASLRQSEFNPYTEKEKWEADAEIRRAEYRAKVDAFFEEFEKANLKQTRLS